MKLLLYSDLQADSGGLRCFHDPAKPLQIHRVEMFYEILYTLYQENNCAGLVDLGDTFNDRTALDYPTLDAVLAGLEPFPDSEWNIRLAGNHDQYFRNSELDNGRVLAHKFKHIRKDAVISIEDEDSVLFCAAFPNTDTQTADWLSASAYAYRGVGNRILLGHFQVVGAQLNSGTAINGIPKAALKPFTLSLLGHVHRPQEVAPNAYYVGSPFQQNFGEKNEVKRVAILDTAASEVEWIELAGFPEYRVCDFANFVKQVKADEEHRYQVILKSTADSEQFYAHPLMSRAEAIYDFALSGDTKELVSAPAAWTKESVMARYLQHVKPSSKNITCSDDEMMEYSKMLTTEA